MGLTISEYIRQRTLNGYCIQINVTELQRLIWEVNKIGVNINQIAKLCNESKMVSPVSMSRLEKEHHRLWCMMDEFIGVVADKERLYELVKK